MMNWREYVAMGNEHLRGDPVMARLVNRLEPPERRTGGDLYQDLLDVILSQQLSVKAAAAIMDRFLSLFPHRDPTPMRVLSMAEEDLRAVGLSRPKIRYITGVARAVQDGEVDLAAAAYLDDEAFVRELTRLHGVGRWSAEMLLIFSLRRPDVFSLGDLGLRNAVARWYAVDRDDHDAITRIAGRWSPYRSLASLYLWESLSNAPDLAG